MRTRVEIGEVSVPRLARHVKLRFDEARGQWIMLAPERLLVPDEIALEVLRLVDGAATVGGIVGQLAARFQAPPGEVQADVIQMLQDLADKGMIEA